MWAEACLPLPRFARRMTGLCWTLLSTSSHKAIRVEACRLLLEELSPTQLQTSLPIVAEKEDLQALLSVLLERIAKYEEDVNEEIVLLGQLVAVLEGSQPTNHLRGHGGDMTEREEEEKRGGAHHQHSHNTNNTKEKEKMVEQVGNDEEEKSLHFWNDENSLFNQISNAIDRVVPLGCFTPSSTPLITHYKQ